MYFYEVLSYAKLGVWLIIRKFEPTGAWAVYCEAPNQINAYELRNTLNESARNKKAKEAQESKLPKLEVER